MNKKSKKPLALIIIVLVIALAAVGYGAYAYMNKSWPFAASMSGSSAATVEITKLSAKNDVLTVGVNVKDTEEKGHCVLSVMGKTTGLKIDDAETKKKSKQDVPFTDCLGWSVGIKDFPAGKYKVEVEYVGASGSAKTSKEVTVK